MKVDVHHADLAKDEGGEHTQINGVNTARDDPVSRDSEEDQQVDTGVEVVRVEELLWDTSPGRGGEGAAGDEQQAAMKLRFLAPENSESEGYRETGNILQRDE